MTTTIQVYPKMQQLLLLQYELSQRAARHMQTHPNHSFRKSCADEAFHLMPEVWSQGVCMLHGLCMPQGQLLPHAPSAILQCYAISASYVECKPASCECRSAGSNQHIR